MLTYAYFTLVLSEDSKELDSILFGVPLFHYLEGDMGSLSITRELLTKDYAVLRFAAEMVDVRGGLRDYVPRWAGPSRLPQWHDATPTPSPVPESVSLSASSPDREPFVSPTPPPLTMVSDHNNSTPSVHAAQQLPRKYKYRS